MVEVEFQPNCTTVEMTQKNEAEKAGLHVDNGMAEDKATSVESDPWDPPYPPYDSSTHKSYPEWCKQRNALLKAARATNIIIPDRTPQMVHSMFYEIYPDLLPILKKDNVRCFLRLYVEHRNCFNCGFTIIPEALNRTIIEDALRCAKVILEGKAPELEGFRANPNYMNKYGYFPLHEAAERFSVDMVKLLLDHGALTNLRTAGTLVVEDLLPLHVAVENTCLHKYLEENLLPNQEHTNCPTKKDANYIHKIICLLCLPEMRIFLDTTRLLAEHTDNVVEEIWAYMKDGKLLQAAVLLLAAQGHIRLGSSCNSNGNNVVDGFSTIINRLAEEADAIKPDMFQDEKEKLDLELNCERLSSSLLLVKIIGEAGKALDSYIRTHHEVPQTKVLQHIPHILMDYGFLPTGVIRFENLWPYEWRPEQNGDLPQKHGKMVETLAAAETPNLYPADKKSPRTKFSQRLDRKCVWNSYFPYWRSVLACRYPIKVYPSHAQDDVVRRAQFDQICNYGSKSFGKLSTLVPNGNTSSLVTRIPQVTNMHQPRRLFGTVAFTILKMLKNA